MKPPVVIEKQPNQSSYWICQKLATGPGEVFGRIRFQRGDISIEGINGCDVTDVFQVCMMHLRDTSEEQYKPAVELLEKIIELIDTMASAAETAPTAQEGSEETEAEEPAAVQEAPAPTQP